MAIYQFRLNLIPRKGVINEFGFVPNKLNINIQERNDHYYLEKDKLLDSSDFFVDALTIKFWDSVNILPTEIIYYISKLFPRKPIESKSDYYYWKHYKKTLDISIDHDASLTLSKENGKIKQLYFRADLRENGLEFLNKFIEIAKKYDCLLMDLNGNLIVPEQKEVYKLVKFSNNYKFLKNPEEYLNNLEQS
ncbi:hypothetical protein QFZ37_003658 [Chryseobacterium ginsenosidimutans]|uniref:hypothetical protein n=1 Tax=Chryseobacterium ginsenosidimutans TaxID=687846 RepID=UPI002785B7B9|nr:hypothetical protein [Chryseobacterium ginsenosidimutans]MDQ0595289.1 hypothetical protein [Chryseobacterium ginsenosidimutans]